MQLLKNILWTLYTTLLCPFHAQKALFKVLKIWNINFWIEKDLPSLWNFSENSSDLVTAIVPLGGCVLLVIWATTWKQVRRDFARKDAHRGCSILCRG